MIAAPRLPRADRELIERFEGAWQSGEPPDLAAFLAGSASTGSSARALLVTLIGVDLEYRWKAWSESGGAVAGPSLETYAARHPALGPSESWPDELIVAEYEARRRWGDRPDPREFAARFPGRGDRLMPLLEAIDKRVDSDVPEDRPELPGFEVVEEIGRGGFGVVYRARRAGLDGFVAVKMLVAARRKDSRAVARFEDEARAISRLDHDHIVRVFHVGRHAGSPFLVMEYLDGGTLADRIAAGPLPPAEAARIAESLADALHEAHESGIIHRDLKPANILFDRRRRPKVGDFGLARLVDSGQTGVADILGTPDYMAPEQARGRSRFVTPAADVYALGALLYAMLAGRPPFQGGDAAEIMASVRSHPHPPLRSLVPSVPRDLATIVERCLEKEPDDRFESAGALRDELRRFLAGEPLVIRPPGPAERLYRAIRRNPSRSAIVALGLVVLALGAVALFVFRAKRDAEAARDQVAVEKTAAEAARDRAQTAEAGERAARASEARVRYALNVLLAHQKYRDQDIDAARQRLGDCPEPLRDWEWRYLYRLCHPEKLSIAAHEGEVVAVALSHHRRRLISAGRDGLIKGWDGKTGTLVYQIRYRKADRVLSTISMHEVTTVAVSPDARLVAATMDDNKTVKVWDGETGAERTRILAGTSTVDLAISAAGDPRLVLGSGQVLDPLTGQRTARLGFEDEQLATVFTRNTSIASFVPRALLSGGFMKDSVCLWDTQTGAPLWTYSVPGTGLFGDRGAELSTAALHASGRRFAIGQRNTRVTVFESNEETPAQRAFRMAAGNAPAGPGPLAFKPIETLAGHRDVVLAMAFSQDLSPDVAKLITGSRDGTAKIWDGHGRELSSLSGHTQPVTAVAFGAPTAFSNEGVWVVTGGADGMVKLWDPANMPTPYRSLAPENPAARQDQAQSRGGRAAWTDRTPDAAERIVHGLFTDSVLAVSPDGTCYIVKGGLNIMRRDPTGIYDVASGEKIVAVERSLARDSSIRFAPGGEAVAIGGAGRENDDKDREIEIYPTRKGLATKLLRGHTGKVQLLAYSDDGRWLASAAADGTVRLWDAVDGRLVQTFSAPAAEIRAVQVGPGGTSVLVGWKDGTTSQLEVASGRALRRDRDAAFPELRPEHPSRSSATSPDGTLAAEASQRTIRVSSRRDGQLLHVLRGHSDAVNVVKFTPGGNRVVSGSEDGTLRVWDPVTGMELLSLRGHEGGVSDAIFGPEGRWIITVSKGLGNSDDRVLVWEAPIVERPATPGQRIDR
jgi:WD40 repeat protein/predicted Ser/Thr protein kinase